MDGVIEAFSSAWTRMVDLLFRPFDLLTYLSFAAMCFLANCTSTQSGSFDSSNLDMSNLPLEDVEPLIAGVGVALFIAAGLVMMAVGMVIWAALLFLSSRMTFMFMDGIQGGVPRWDSWGEHAEAANKLWRFRVILAVLSAVWVAGVAIITLLALFGVGFSGADHEVIVLSQGVIGLLIVIVILPPALLGGLLDWFAQDLAAPVMMVTGQSAFSALRELSSAPRFDPLGLIVYIIARVLLSVVLLFIMIPITCLCCCLFMIPGVSTIVFLPIFLFQRALGMHFVAGLDDRFASLGNMERPEPA